MILYGIRTNCQRRYSERMKHVYVLADNPTEAEEKVKKFFLEIGWSELYGEALAIIPLATDKKDYSVLRQLIL